MTFREWWGYVKQDRLGLGFCLVLCAVVAWQLWRLWP